MDNDDRKPARAELDKSASYKMDLDFSNRDDLFAKNQNKDVMVDNDHTVWFTDEDPDTVPAPKKPARFTISSILEGEEPITPDDFAEVMSDLTEQYTELLETHQDDLRAAEKGRSVMLEYMEKAEKGQAHLRDTVNAITKVRERMRAVVEAASEDYSRFANGELY